MLKPPATKYEKCAKRGKPYVREKTQRKLLRRQKKGMSKPKR
jgi:hypothetical protein